MEKSKIKKIKIISRTLLILFGSLLLAFGTAAFLDPFNIVSGGLSGIGIIITNGLSKSGLDLSGLQGRVTDLVVLILNIILLILSFIFLGKKFSLRTLIATFAYPGFLTIFMRCGVSQFFFDSLKNYGGSSRIICGIMGGILTGFGVAITFLGDGSTGGLDILAFILNKYTKIKISISTFLFDFVIILVGLFTIGFGGDEFGLLASLSGVLTALVSAIIIHFVYIGSNSIYVADIISEKEEEISKFVHENLERTTTLINGLGTYSKKDVKVIRIVFEKRELIELKDAVAKIDPKAFITIYQGYNVYGEGFNELKPIFLDSFKTNKLKEKKEEKSEDEI